LADISANNTGNENNKGNALCLLKFLKNGKANTIKKTTPISKEPRNISSINLISVLLNKKSNM
jgi:hypothetical protein